MYIVQVQMMKIPVNSKNITFESKNWSFIIGIDSITILECWFWKQNFKISLKCHQHNDATYTTTPTSMKPIQLIKTPNLYRQSQSLSLLQQWNKSWWYMSRSQHRWKSGRTEPQKDKLKRPYWIKKIWLVIWNSKFWV